jgi:NADH dehydrogenase FAD-containing subunit
MGGVGEEAAMRILVVGGGTGGTILANNLARISPARPRSRC